MEQKQAELIGCWIHYVKLSYDFGFLWSDLEITIYQAWGNQIDMEQKGCELIEISTGVIAVLAFWNIYRCNKNMINDRVIRLLKLNGTSTQEGYTMYRIKGPMR